MRRHPFIMALILVLCLPIACRKQGEDATKKPAVGVEADMAAINTLLDDWVRLYNAGDFKELVSAFYAENAVLLSPVEPPRRGREDLLAGYQRASLLNDERVESSVIRDIRVSGELATAWGFDEGITTPRDGGPPVRYQVQWLMAFERQADGAWKCLYEMYDESPGADAAEVKE
ncbi:MAG: DUF4440 domain-containing protein [Candidatus Aminicenantes bacterium]|nr:DUF4440 domain-containing protein [Candidatus Aminicenantes bacterium]